MCALWIYFLRLLRFQIHIGSNIHSHQITRYDHENNQSETTFSNLLFKANFKSSYQHLDITRITQQDFHSFYSTQSVGFSTTQYRQKFFLGQKIFLIQISFSYSFNSCSLMHFQQEISLFKNLHRAYLSSVESQLDQTLKFYLNPIDVIFIPSHAQDFMPFQPNQLIYYYFNPYFFKRFGYYVFILLKAIFQIYYQLILLWQKQTINKFFVVFEFYRNQKDYCKLLQFFG
ncbi:transmembrane protein, putative (macronuclear) [Tetrahymena thermophila SB210]|uniref:Transmembrane protein, putative n=1 Tax=Tetrahymena thermophila (strain SB210) TaxID=312017 RepID=W7X6B4_TETTS|nr:transmembrane protein, putative [Tetrahymena thermophila SB210]EWS72942.1 transmembrane protein, putative [Tetrahymena thermophila SB210]|eukprot:XP_012654509.1 transmembrane protein, putative [Tetrahymena thermophila SB210]